MSVASAAASLMNTMSKAPLAMSAIVPPFVPLKITSRFTFLTYQSKSCCVLFQAATDCVATLLMSIGSKENTSDLNILNLSLLSKFRYEYGVPPIAHISAADAVVPFGCPSHSNISLPEYLSLCPDDIVLACSRYTFPLTCIVLIVTFRPILIVMSDPNIGMKIGVLTDAVEMFVV